MQRRSVAGCDRRSVPRHSDGDDEFPLRRSFRRRAERYGLVDACLAGAGVFLVATMALLGTYSIYVARRRRNAQARAALEPPPLSTLADPRVILAGLQIVQAIGFKRLLPILAIGGVFALASRPASEGRRRARARGREPLPL